MNPPDVDSLLDPAPDLVRPTSLSVDAGLDPDRARHMVRIGQLLYTFWHTGDTKYLDAAVEPEFVDNTPPAGRPPGLEGPRVASAAFHDAVPDLTCELADLLVVDDKLAVRLHLRGHFTGTYEGRAGEGQEIDFIAFDIQLVGEDKIVADWHLEDNLTFLLQAGIVSLS